MSWIVTILAFGSIVAFHEFGHFIIARFFGMKVDTFSIGLGKKLFSFKWRGTEYRISLLPLGGYVNLGDSMIKEDFDRKNPDHKDYFAFKPAYQRLLVLFAGPVFNLILAVILLFGLFYSTGRPVGATKVIDQVADGLPAEKAGIKKGDEIVAINNVKVDSWEQTRAEIKKTEGEEFSLRVLRDNQELELLIKPTEIDGKKIIGISMALLFEPISIFDAGKDAISGVYQNIKLQLGGLAGLFTGKTSGKEVSGPVGIFQFTNQAAKRGVEDLIFIMVMINVALGVFNLLPIPLLDGGWILLIFFELLLGRPLSKKVQERLLLLGFVTMMLLLFYGTSNDLARIFNK